jgi:hypothetical protein
MIAIAVTVVVFVAGFVVVLALRPHERPKEKRRRLGVSTQDDVASGIMPSAGGDDGHHVHHGDHSSHGGGHDAGGGFGDAGGHGGH